MYTEADIERMESAFRGWKISDEAGRTIACIMLFPSGEVEYIGVNDRYQRQGLATLLWKYLVRTGEQPMHSIHRTVEGNAWALAVGGTTPRRCTKRTCTTCH